MPEDAAHETRSVFVPAETPASRKTPDLWNFVAIGSPWVGGLTNGNRAAPDCLWGRRLCGFLAVAEAASDQPIGVAMTELSRAVPLVAPKVQLSLIVVVPAGVTACMATFPRPTVTVFQRPESSS